MPKLYHKKSRRGCSRCRQRRVKCDEEKPRCGACARHGVSCEYRQQYEHDQAGSHACHTLSASSVAQNSNGTDFSPPDQQDAAENACIAQLPQLATSATATTTPTELRLFQYWLLYTSQSFSIAHDYWRVRIPIIASEHRPVLDGVLAITALHLHRQTDLESPIGHAHRSKEPPVDNAIFMAGATSVDMLRTAVHYLYCAMRGHREAFAKVDKETAEAVYLSSVLITLTTAFLLSADDRVENRVAPYDESMWLRLGAGPRELVPVWGTFVDEGHPLTLTGAMQGGPDLADNHELFKVEHGRPFEVLMTWASEFEILNPEDGDAYQRTISYIGLIHKNITEGLEHPHVTGRRFWAIPSRLPPRFVDLALSQQPRALVVLAHVFALMKLLSRHVPWMTGIAEKHIPRLEAKIPPGWRPVMSWPAAITAWNEDGEEDAPLPPSKLEISEAMTARVRVNA